MLLDGVFSVSLVLVVMTVRSIALCREDGGGDLPFYCCTETRRLSTSRYSGGLCVGSFQLLVLFAGGELCSEEMTDNQGGL